MWKRFNSKILNEILKAFSLFISVGIITFPLISYSLYSQIIVIYIIMFPLPLCYTFPATRPLRF